MFSAHSSQMRNEKKIRTKFSLPDLTFSLRNISLAEMKKHATATFSTFYYSQEYLANGILTAKYNTLLNDFKLCQTDKIVHKL